MKVLVACEESQAVTKELRALGTEDGGMSMQSTYEKLKAEIAHTAKTPQEYEKRNVISEMEAKEDGQT